MMNVPVWTSYGVDLPDGTQLRMCYHWTEHYAYMHSGRFYVAGEYADSPSGAAKVISRGEHLNGWHYWSARRPDDEEWTPLWVLRNRAQADKCE